ncbi:NUDIX domain-containing protein [Bacillus niameyensis]|uniref:NUDIX domain-containing protein n=1 Tax=Bacillus niameyensis TaxID=1522308 RepID=UPI0008412264|nr:NUDIX hydrolase [Bacillus niameyensis]
MTLLTQNNGFKFLNFLFVKEEEMDQYQPLAGSFAIITSEQKYLICYNVWRKQWELPAGKREEGEPAKECAKRELFEETGQNVTDLEFIGLLKMENISDGKLKFNPVYFSSIKKLNPFIANEETTGIMLWDLEEKIDNIDEVDYKLLDYINRSPRFRSNGE